jgi:hypothetical protein
MKRRSYDKAQQALQAKKTQVESAIKANDQHTVCSSLSHTALMLIRTLRQAERNAKLATLHGPAGPAEASKLVEEGTKSPAGPSA